MDYYAETPVERNPWLPPIILGGGCVVASLSSRLLTAGVGGYAAFNPACGLLLGVLAIMPRQRWLHFLAASLVARIVVDLIVGTSLAISTTVWIPMTCGAAIGGAAYKWLSREEHSLTRRMLLFVMISLAAPLLSAIWSARFSIVYTADDGWVPRFIFWWTRDALGNLVAGPLVVAWRPFLVQAKDRGWDRVAAEGLAIIAIFSLVDWAVESILPGRFAVLPFWLCPFLLWGALRYGPFGAAYVALSTAMLTFYHLHSLSAGAAEISFYTYQLAVVLFVLSLGGTAIIVGATASDLHELALSLADNDAMLRGSLRELELFYQSVPIGHALLDHDLNFERVNNRLAKLHHCFPEDMLGHSLEILNEETASKEVLAAARSVLRHGVSVTGVEVSETEKWGTEGGLYVEKSFYPSFDPSGDVNGVHMIVIDVSDRQRRKQVEQELLLQRRYEEMLRASEYHFRQLADNAPVLIWTSDDRGNRTYFNRRWRSFLGSDSVGFAAWRELLHPDDRDRYRQCETEARRDRKCWSIEYRCRHRDGEYRWMLENACPNIDDMGVLRGYHGSCIDITDRRNYEEELSRVKELLAEIQRLAKIGGWQLDLTTDEFIWTEEMYSILETPLGSTLSRDEALHFHDPQDRDYVSDVLNRAILDRSPFEFELPITTQQGNRRWIRAVGRPRVVDDKVVRVIGSVQDITERRLIDDSLRVSEERFRKAFLHSGIGMALLDLNGQFERVNNALCQMLGYTEEEFLGMKFPDITHPDDISASRTQMERLLGGAVMSYQLEKRYRHKDGHTVWTHLTGSLVRDSDRKPLHYIAQIHDISQRRRDREELLKARNDLKVANDLLNGIIDGTPDMIAAVDSEYRILLYNRAFQQECADLLGNRVHVGMTLDDLFAGHDGVGGTLRGDWARALDGDSFTSEYTFASSDRRSRVFQTSFSPVCDIAGRQVAAAHIVRDITAMHQSEQELRAALTEKEVLLKEVHHRVKNNLQIVSSLLYLQASQLENPEIKETLRESQSRVRSMALIHENLYRSGNLGNIQFDVHAENLCGQLVSTYGIDSQRVHLELDVKPITLDLDYAIPLSLLLNELIANALKHAFPDDRSGTVSVTMARRDSGEIELVVRDDGIGMRATTDSEPMPSQQTAVVAAAGSSHSRSAGTDHCNDRTAGEERQREDQVAVISDVQEPVLSRSSLLSQGVVTLDSPRSLGLQLVKTLTQQLKGSIDVRVEHGTEFRFCFPSGSRKAHSHV